MTGVAKPVVVVRGGSRRPPDRDVIRKLAAWAARR